MKYLEVTNMYDVIVVGAGFAGATVANRLASKSKKILVIDKREQSHPYCSTYIQPIFLSYVS